MDPTVSNILINHIFKEIVDWNNRLSRAPYLDRNGERLFDLTIVGGVSLNSYIRRLYPTPDLDLKLTYNKLIRDKREYNLLYSLDCDLTKPDYDPDRADVSPFIPHVEANKGSETIRPSFNVLRAMIVADIASSLENYMRQQVNSSLLRLVKEDILGKIFKTSITFLDPVYFISPKKALECIEKNPFLKEMVFSVVYTLSEFRHDCTLVDLSMFTNLKSENATVLNQPLVNNIVYTEFYPFYASRVSIVDRNSNPVIPVNYLPYSPIDVPLASLHFVLGDAYIVQHTHHKPDKRLAIRKKIIYLLENLRRELGAGDILSDPRRSEADEVIDQLLTLLPVDVEVLTMRKDGKYVQPTFKGVDEKVHKSLQKLDIYVTQDVLPMYNHFNKRDVPFARLTLPVEVDLYRPKIWIKEPSRYVKYTDENGKQIICRDRIKCSKVCTEPPRGRPQYSDTKERGQGESRGRGRGRGYDLSLIHIL